MILLDLDKLTNQVILLEKGLPVIPFAQPSIFSLDDKTPEDDCKQKSRPGKRSMRTTLILEEETESVTVIINFIKLDLSS